MVLDSSDDRSVDDERHEHPIWNWSGMSDDELRSILSDPDHDRFASVAARLLESSMDADVVFEYLDPKVFARHFDRIESSMGHGSEVQQNRYLWKRMANVIRENEGMNSSDSSEKQSPAQPEGSESAQRIGQRVRKIRKKEGLSQAELADRLGVSRQVISRLENGKHDPSFKKIERVFEAMGYRPYLKLDKQ